VIRLAFLAALLSVVAVVVAFGESPDGALQTWALHAQAIVPTVKAGQADPGGKYFGAPPDPAVTRHYYIAAELTPWDYTPRGQTAVCVHTVADGTPTPHVAFKVRYFEYTDETFTAKVLPDERLGILGPVLRGTVGQYLAITFLNRTQYPLSMHPHGVKYDKDSEGALYEPKPGLGAAIGPGARFTYVWKLDESSGPLPGEPSSKCWLYHSHVCGDEEANLGLVGFIIVPDPKRARLDGTPADVDREMASLFMIFREPKAPATDDDDDDDNDQVMVPGDPPVLDSDDRHGEAIEQHYAINGYAYGGFTGLEMNEGERVRWYLFGLGDEDDMHTAHWHGLRVIEEGRRRTDVIELLPATMKVADLVADNPGTWMFHCHVAEHMMGGMFTNCTVHPAAQPVKNRPEETFFGLPSSAQSLRIQAEEAGDSIRLHGSVTVPGAFAIGKAHIELRIGDDAAVFQQDGTGKASSSDASFHALNADPYGFVYGGVMEFEVSLRGSDWTKAWKQMMSNVSNESAESKPVHLKINGVEHR